VQLRQDNKEGTLYNIVGFQTHLKFGDQKKVFSLIPGLEAAEFVRYGVMHRNTFINSPKLLDATFNYISKKNLFFAGQMSGVEGYVESAASGLNAGINASHLFLQKDKIIFPTSTAIGALSHYISDGSVKNFQPMNVNFGIVDTLNQRIRDKRQKNSEISKRAIEAILEVKAKI
ncbi:MAG: FAD-dependent oxidoreductase, partial [Clostridiaceae bacterium]|nr:FAD-dependent oxidoreductase [Clostridiaceae bacterium]